MSWTAIVLAGQRPVIDPLAHHFGVAAKAEIPVLGMPMLARVLATLLATPAIARIVILAQSPEAFRSPEVTALLADPRIALAHSGDGISRSIAAVVGTDVAPWPILVTTADHPLLTPAIVAGFLARTGDADVAIGMVERRVMRATYPDSRRTWLRFRDGAWSGANLFALRTPRAGPALDLWSRAERDRKQVLKLFLHFGPLLALRAITRTISLADALDTAGRKLGLTARLISLDQPEAAIDVDKPADHAQAEAILRARATLPQIAPAPPFS